MKKIALNVAYSALWTLHRVYVHASGFTFRSWL